MEKVCEMYEISKPTVYAWIKKGLPVHYVGKIPFFEEIEINSFIKGGGKIERISVTNKK